MRRQRAGARRIKNIWKIPRLLWGLCGSILRFFSCKTYSQNLVRLSCGVRGLTIKENVQKSIIINIEKIKKQRCGSSRTPKKRTRVKRSLSIVCLCRHRVLHTPHFDILQVWTLSLTLPFVSRIVSNIQPRPSYHTIEKIDQ